jgi:EAL domain-containing protein (putative c-di-GMP-specific phosphodiesterase class I)
MPPLEAITASAAGAEFVWTLENQAGGATLTLQRFPAVLGRRANVDLCVPHPSVSGVHAEFQRDGQSLLLRDCGSTNGTFVNGRRIEAPHALATNDLLHFGEAVFRLQRRREQEPAGINSTRCAEDVCDQALALVQFDRLLTDRAVTPYYQPIVEAGGQHVAYEVLGRSTLFGLNTPGPMFRAAAVLQKEAELSRLLRNEAISTRRQSKAPHLFFNTHPRELDDVRALIASLAELRRIEPSQTLTLEIHETAALEAVSMKELRTALFDLQIGLAYDDFGAGQARLAELVETAPDYVKFDMRLIQGIHHAPEAHRKMVGSLVRLVSDLNIVPLAEGIESPPEAEVCRALEFRLFQGFYFGRPAPAGQYLLRKPAFDPTRATP